MTVKKTPHEIDLIVGANIRNLRNARWISQEALGEALGVTFQQVQKYEKATNRVSASRLAGIARVLECSLADLFAGTTLTGPENVRPERLSPQASRVARLYDTLEDDQRDAVLRLLRSMRPGGSALPDFARTCPIVITQAHSA